MAKSRIMYNIPTPKGRRFAISDIHGNCKTFLALLDKVSFCTEDQLFILGDFISRGKRSKAVLKTLIEMQENGYEIYPLRGNHENFLATYIEAAPYHKLLEFLGRGGLLGIADNYGKVKKKYKKFILKLPYYYESGNFLLVHAGFDFSNKPFKNTDAMTTTRKISPNKGILNGKYIIHGHTPISIKAIKASIRNNSQVINIDNGCILKDEVDKGNLICLNLDSLKIISQKNID